MKVLVGAASIAVVAFVSYLFWGEWQMLQARTLEERAQQIAFDLIAEEAGVDDGNRLKVKMFCDGMRDLLQTESARFASAGERDIPRRCEAAGL